MIFCRIVTVRGNYIFISSISYREFRRDSSQLSLYTIHFYDSNAIDSNLLYFGLWPSQKCHSKVMHRKEEIHSNGSYERKSRGLKLADEIGRGKKFPWYTHRLTNRKRLTSELHDSYFRLTTIQHSIPKIEWAIKCALNYYITQSRQSSSSVAVQLEMEIDEFMVGKATPGRRGPRAPDWIGVQRRCW